MRTLYVNVVYYFINRTCGAVCDAVHHVHSNEADPNKTIFSECNKTYVRTVTFFTTARCTILMKHSANCHPGLEVDSEGELMSLRQGVVEESKYEMTAILIPHTNFKVVI
jgi:hypothetical protein